MFDEKIEYRLLSYVINDHALKNTFVHAKAEEGEIPSFHEVKNKLPIPVWEGRQDAIDCYYKAWELAWGNLRKADEKAGFVSNFIDTAFNGYLFLWDSSFIVMFGKYAARYFNFQKTLDNFYSHQHIDGYIGRELCERELAEQWSRDDPVSTGPNILPWAEWSYYLSTRDIDRLAKVFDPLCAYHDWLRNNRSWQDGTYWSNGYACGMDNIPRQEEGYDPHFSHGFMSWIDACAQQYLSANILVKMGKVLNRADETASYKEEAKRLKSVINRKMWDGESAFYYDLKRDGRRGKVKSVGAYWTLLAGLVPKGRADAFVAHLDDEREFKRPNRIPALSADHVAYEQTGGYWKGGVWAPTNYMTLCGLHDYGYDRLAFEIAYDYLNAVLEVYRRTGTVYENYAPERLNGCFAKGEPAKADFVGWTGLAPISILFEFVFGIHPVAAEKKIVWNLTLTEAHGVRQYPLGDATVDLYSRQRNANEAPMVEITADKPITVEVICEGKKYIYHTK